MNDAPSPAELDADLLCDAVSSTPLAPPVDAAELAAELPSDDAPLPSDAPAAEPKPVSELLDEMGIEAAKLLAENFGPLGLHALVIVTDAAGQQFSFRSATLGPNATYGLLCRVKALAKRFYCTF